MFVCVFLLSTAYHRNGKPVSICNPQTGWTLHVITFSGNVVMDGVVHPPVSRLFIVVVPWVLGSLSTAVGRGHIINGPYCFLSCTLFCMSLSLLPSYRINETCPPPPKVGPVLLLPCPLLKIVLSTVVASACCLNSEVKMWWKYPDVFIAEVNASLKTTEGACRYYVRAWRFCESLTGSQADTNTSKVDAFKAVFTAEGSQGSASPIEGTWFTTNFHLS